MAKNKPNTVLRFWQPLWKYYKQVLFLVGALGILCIGMYFQWPVVIKLDNYLSPVFGLITFPITLAILYFQGYQRWEDNLEKRLTVRYVYVEPTGDTTEIARIEKAYLSGEGDIRAWAQQLGRQIMGDLKFDLNWDREDPKIVCEDKQWCKEYEVIIYLTEKPLGLTSILSGSPSKPSFQHSEITVESSTIIWRRKIIKKHAH